MANPAQVMREFAQQAWPGAVVSERGRNWIKHSHPSVPGKAMVDASIDPLHILGTEAEINTAWQSTTGGAWQYQMLRADYNVYARSVLNAGDLVQYVDPITAENVTFQPLSLNWVNEVNSRQQIATTQAVAAVVNDDVLVWQNGYGPGRHFQYQTQTARLQKLLTIDSVANLPAATVTGTVWLEMEFIIKLSTGIDPYLDGVKWSRTTTRVRTANRIEFRSIANGAVLWYMDSPKAWGSDASSVVGQYEMRRQGGNYYITVRIPKTWVDTAIFPIYVDPTIEPQVGVGANDGKWGLFFGGEDFNETDAEMWVGNRIAGQREDYSIFARFTNVTVPVGATIDVAYLSLRGAATDSSSGWAATLWMNDADNPSAPTDYASVEGLVHTTATTSWTNAAVTAGTFVNSPSIVSAVQEVVDRSGWASGNAMIVGIENNASSSGIYRAFNGYEAGASYAPILHIEYTEASSGVTVTPSPASSTSAGVDPTVVYGAISITPAVASSTSAGVDPTTVQGAITITPSVASATSSGIDPTTIQGAITLTPAAALTTADGVDPTIALGAVTLTPASADATGSGVDPSVITSIIPASADAVGGGVDPVVIYGAITVTPATADATGSGIDPTVSFGGVTIIPAVALDATSGVDPTVILGAVVVAPAAAEGVSSGIDPTVVYGATTATPLPAYATSGGVDPMVMEGNVAITVAPLPADALASLIGPVVVAGEPAFINGLHDRAVIPGQRGMIISAIGIMISK